MRFAALAVLSHDGQILVATRMARTFAYGAVSVILVLYLVALGFDGAGVGLLLTLTLVGDAAISLWLTTRADAIGRRRVLMAGSALMLGAGLLFALSGDFWVLLIAATIGVISVTGGEVGPFRAIEEASLSQVLSDRERTRIFAWYALAGSFAGAFGALFAGLLVSGLQGMGASKIDSYRAVIVAYALVGAAVALAFGLLSAAVEVPEASRSTIAGRLGLHRSCGTVLRLSALFSLDSFGGALVSQSLVAFWLTERFGAQPVLLGGIFFVSNGLAGLSALVAARLGARFGLVRTMVFTHLPANLVLLVIPLMPTLPLAALAMFVRFSMNSMDIPARQSYVVAVVDPDERSAAGGVTGIARTISSAPAPLISTPLMAIPELASLPFFAAGTLKIAYDLLLYRLFVALRPPEELQDSPDSEPLKAGSGGAPER